MDNTAAPGFRGDRLSLVRVVRYALAGLIWLCGAPAVSAADTSTLAPWTASESAGLSLDTLDGRHLALDEFADRVVLVHFFATWCEPCVREMAALDDLGRGMPGGRIAILAIDVGEPDSRVRRFFEDHPVGFPVLLDRDRAVMKRWDVFALPSTFVLARDLKPALQAQGEVDWQDAAIRGAVLGLVDRNQEEAKKWEAVR